MKQTRHSMMAKGIIVLLSLLVLIFAMTYTWFTDSTTPSSAGSFIAKTDKNSEFDIAIGFSTPDTNGYKISDWNTTGSLDFTNLVVTGDAGSPYNLLKNFAPVDLTGDGVTLIRPEMKSKNVDIDYSKNTFELPTPNREFISFDLIVRSSAANVNIKLTDESYVLGAIEGTTPGTTPDNTKLVISSGDSKSDYGNFSEDSVVGAVRMSFVDYTSTMNTYNKLISEDNTLESTPALLWIPRSDIYLNSTNNLNDWTLKLKNYSTGNFPSGNGKYADGSSGTYKDIASTHYYYGIFDPDNYVNGSPVGGLSNYDTAPSVTDLTASGQTIVTTSSSITNQENGKTYYYSKCRVNLWVDGCDAEARRAIDGGEFWFTLSLTAS